MLSIWLANCHSPIAMIDQLLLIFLYENLESGQEGLCLFGMRRDVMFTLLASILIIYFLIGRDEH